MYMSWIILTWSLIRSNVQSSVCIGERYFTVRGAGRTRKLPFLHAMWVPVKTTGTIGRRVCSAKWTKPCCSDSTQKPWCEYVSPCNLLGDYKPWHFDPENKSEIVTTTSLLNLFGRMGESSKFDKKGYSVSWRWTDFPRTMHWKVHSHAVLKQRLSLFFDPKHDEHTICKKWKLNIIQEWYTFLKGRRRPFLDLVPSGKMIKDRLFSTTARAAWWE